MHLLPLTAPFASIEALDAELAQTARAAGAQKYALGAGFDGACEEGILLEQAMHHTVRQMRNLVRASRSVRDVDLTAIAVEDRSTLTITVDREDAWLFECAHRVVSRVAGTTREESLEGQRNAVNRTSANTPARRRRRLLKRVSIPGTETQPPSTASSAPSQPTSPAEI